MIGRQLDLFGGPLKPPKNILVEEEAVVPEPEVVVPEAPIPVPAADAEPENRTEPIQEGAGVHVQMPASDYPGDIFFPDETPPEYEPDVEPFKLNELQEDYTLEEAIAAEFISEALPGNETDAHVGEDESGVEAEEVILSEPVFELPGSEFVSEEPAIEEPTEEETADEESAVEEPTIEEPAIEEPTEEETAEEETAVEEPAIEEPTEEEAADEESVVEEPEMEEPLAEVSSAEEHTVEFLETGTILEVGEELSQEDTESDSEIQEVVPDVTGSLDEEPEWVGNQLADSDPEFAIEEEQEELTKESVAREDLEPEAIRSGGAQQPAHEVAAEPIEAEVAEGTEVGPLNLPTDQALYSRQYYTMRETANMFNVNQSLLRFWENEFDILKPKKNRKGDRYFRPDDIKNLELIYHLLRVRKFTISGAKDYLKNKAKSLDTFVMVQRLEKLKLFLQELKTHA